MGPTEWQGSLVLLVLYYFPVKVSPISILHHDAQRGRIFIEEGFFVGDDVAVTKIWSRHSQRNSLDTRENAHFVERVQLLPL
jgi:hypothetical protein